MKQLNRVLVGWAMLMIVSQTMAQKIDETRMTRDIAVAENVLSTLIKQEFDRRNFFPIQVKGNYRAGYGITFTIPVDMLTPMVWGSSTDLGMLDGTPGAFSYSFSWSGDGGYTEEIEGVEPPPPPSPNKEIEKKGIEREKDKDKKALQKESERVSEEMRKSDQELKRTSTSVRGVARPVRNTDSLRQITNEKVIQVAKSFLADYGDMLSQLAPDERIVITNRGENQYWHGASKRSLLSVEVLKSELNQFRQGKLNREQLLSKVKVVNTSSTGKVEPDIELLTSIFNRLYRNDLSSTFFTEGSSYHERMADYGVIIYMQVYSSNQIKEGLFNMPTVNLRQIDQVTRDKKVKELYPLFESELKDNILEYGRTVKSLGDNELLVFNVKITRCNGCGIPSDIELAIKNSVLKDYNAGKIDKSSALSKITVKKGAIQ